MEEGGERLEMEMYWVIVEKHGPAKDPNKVILEQMPHRGSE